jgi:putative ABC transport system substrate-binding protein
MPADSSASKEVGTAALLVIGVARSCLAAGNLFKREQAQPSQDHHCHVCLGRGREHRSICAFIAKSVTTSIPIVFSTAADPVQLGLVASLNRPGGNVTGVTTVSAELEAKRLGLLRELVPAATSIAALVNPTRPGVDVQLAQAQQAARVLGLPLHILKASSERDLDAVFVTLVQLRAGALMITADGLFADRLDQIAALARRYSVPAMFQFREFATAGGLMSYGSRFGESYHQAGILAGRILRGEKAADLPVMQPTKFELVINMRTAKALGIEVPILMQMLADEVIE